ncbi:hypothetical protein K503DRAFT_769561 [Rhizopogon vinicolor AM-OR11-026]|uniref:Uncharacterized protein n=1 Tax=Rhizopogon vinicolor AM-OR11-026 TaxID=1314800 RepID=A0A1B7N3D4_9AGAM|nr:hypothetical protein K503DRAFT_769561 [Rhizopogon vinicolor AM-OR11-026]
MSTLTQPTVAVIGTCDTKLEALRFLKRTIQSTAVCHAIIIDVGSYDPSDSQDIDIPRTDVLKEYETAIRNMPSRGEALDTMTIALTQLLARLHSAQSIMGVIGAGGSGNTSVCTKAFRDALPIGFPKLMVSTMASGNVSHYVGETDMTMMYSVVDVASMNPILETVLGNAADAISGMAKRYLMRADMKSSLSSRPAIAVSMFGLTTPCVQVATQKLEELGYSVVAFHATGAGGLAMERLIREGHFVGVLDITTTELADELVGGVLTAGPRRLEAAASCGIPQVVSVGALDMVNFGPVDTIPKQFQGRLFHHHNASVTLMRTSREECSRLGEIIAEKLKGAPRNKTRVILPLRGFSGIDKERGPFRDAEADGALLEALKSSLQCPAQELDVNINDPSFALMIATTLHDLLQVEGFRHDV